jgi:DNA polymerase I-like protein with 3'-5' exonuclease and polymerase domains
LIPDWLHQLIYVHDQFVVECPEDRVEEGIPLLEDAMRKGMGLYLKNAPIKMETEVGDVWC